MSIFLFKIFIDALHDTGRNLFLIAGGIELPVLGRIAHKAALQNHGRNLRPVDGRVIIGADRGVGPLSRGL